MGSLSCVDFVEFSSEIVMGCCKKMLVSETCVFMRLQAKSGCHSADKDGKQDSRLLLALEHLWEKNADV